MDTSSRSLNQLAARIEGGDAAAVTQFRRAFEPHMAGVVKRALRSGSPANALSRRIQEKARQLAGGNGLWPADRLELVVKLVTRDLCDSAVERLQHPGGSPRAARETVLC
jgi:hypothetical protein